MKISDRDKLNGLIDPDFGRFLLSALDNLEEERVADLDELLKNCGSTREELQERFCCEIGQNEAMDRAFIAMNHVDSHLVHHPYIQFSPKAYRLAQLASMCLAQLYQECGRAEFKTTGTTKCSKYSQPLVSRRGFLSSLKSYYSLFWLKMVGPVEQESPS